MIAPRARVVAGREAKPIGLIVGRTIHGTARMAGFGFGVNALLERRDGLFVDGEPYTAEMGRYLVLFGHDREKPLPNKIMGQRSVVKNYLGNPQRGNNHGSSRRERAVYQRETSSRLP